MANENQQQQQDLTFILNDLNARIRVLENKYSLFGERILIINQNMIDEYKKLSRKDKTIDDEVKEIKKEIFNIKEIISGLTKELKLFARKDNLQVLEKYINLWNPMNFITEKEVINLIKNHEDILSKEDIKDIVRKQKQEMIEILTDELKGGLLTKKDVLDLIKKEGGKNSE